MTKDDLDAHQLIADAIIKHSENLGRMVDYIEVGVHVGNSAEAALATEKVRHALLVDNFSLPPSSRGRVEKRLSPYRSLFEIREGDSRAVLPAVTGQFDVGLVDGDHSAECCLSDMTHMLPLLRPDGIMFVHDLTNPDFTYLKQVVEKFARENNLTMKFHDHVHNALGELTRCQT